MFWVRKMSRTSVGCFRWSHSLLQHLLFPMHTGWVTKLLQGSTSKKYSQEIQSRYIVQDNSWERQTRNTIEKSRFPDCYSIFPFSILMHTHWLTKWFSRSVCRRINRAIRILQYDAFIIHHSENKYFLLLLLLLCYAQAYPRLAHY